MWGRVLLLTWQRINSEDIMLGILGRPSQHRSLVARGLDVVLTLLIAVIAIFVSFSRSPCCR